MKEVAWGREEFKADFKGWDSHSVWNYSTEFSPPRGQQILRKGCHHTTRKGKGDYRHQHARLIIKRGETEPFPEREIGKRKVGIKPGLLRRKRSYNETRKRGGGGGG